jgi:hypothetical protein
VCFCLLDASSGDRQGQGDASSSTHVPTDSENSIFFARVNDALRFPESATSLIAPSGNCQAFLPYGEKGLLVVAANVDGANGLMSSRFAPDRYLDGPTEQSP